MLCTSVEPFLLGNNHTTTQHAIICPTVSLCIVLQGKSEARVPLTAGQKREVDDAFALFDYAKTGVLDLHDVKVCVRERGEGGGGEYNVLQRASLNNASDTHLPMYARLLRLLISF